VALLSLPVVRFGVASGEAVGWKEGVASSGAEVELLVSVGSIVVSGSTGLRAVRVALAVDVGVALGAGSAGDGANRATSWAEPFCSAAMSFRVSLITAELIGAILSTRAARGSAL
jgi:hypothetical protein